MISSITAGKNAEVYRGILELAARFGYLSIEEVEYLFGCGRVTSMNRLDYLTNRAKLLQKFDSFTRPSNFYCLTHLGRELVRKLALSDEIIHFVPSDYRLFYQNHHRQLIQCYIAVRKVFGSRFIGWVSESQLKKEYTKTRVVDGEFYLRGDPEKFSSGDIVKCWVELELSLKSPGRYRKQFSKLAEQVFDPFDKTQNIDRLYFLAGSLAIKERLKGYSSRHDWGDCSIHFLWANEFFQNHSALLKLDGTVEQKELSV